MKQEEVDALYDVMQSAMNLKMAIKKMEAIANKDFLRPDSFFSTVLENFVTGKFYEIVGGEHWGELK